MQWILIILVLMIAIPILSVVALVYGVTSDYVLPFVKDYGSEIIVAIVILIILGGLVSGFLLTLKNEVSGPVSIGIGICFVFFALLTTREVVISAHGAYRVIVYGATLFLFSCAGGAVFYGIGAMRWGWGQDRF